MEQDLPGGFDWLSICRGLGNFLDGWLCIAKNRGMQEVEGLIMEISFGRALGVFWNLSDGSLGKNQEIEMSGGIEGGSG